MLWIAITLIVFVCFCKWIGSEHGEFIGLAMMLGILLMIVVSAVVSFNTPEFTLENIKFVSEESVIVSTDNRIYIELQPKQYLIPSGSGYVISDSDKYYPVSTMEEIFEKGEKSDLHIVSSDEYGVPVIKTYVYKNSVFYFNFLEARRFKILVLPENWSIPAN